MQGVKIEGFTQSASSGVRMELIFEGFDRGIPKIVQSGAAPAIKYAYEITYRMPVTVKIEVPGKGQIVNEKVPSTESFRTFKTAEYKTKAELEMWWNENQSTVWDDRQKNAAAEAIPGINDYLNEKFGYPVKARSLEVYTVKSKDYDYTDYLNAYQAFQDGVMMLQYPNQLAQAQAKLQTAIDLWNNALKESNINDKKARVDKTITACTYVNLAEAYIWMNDFSNAEINANKAINIDVGKYNKDAKPKLEFIRDMRNRFSANNK
jgi:tetratricopeptide (TPR) repeat protein